MLEPPLRGDSNGYPQSMFFIRGVWLVLIKSCPVEISELNANSVDPDQMPRSAASDLGLHCLPMSLLWDARHKRVTCEQIFRLIHVSSIQFLSTLWFRQNCPITPTYMYLDKYSLAYRPFSYLSPTPIKQKQLFEIGKKYFRTSHDGTQSQ